LKNRIVNFKDLGEISYKPAWDYQTELFDEIVRVKIKNRDLPEDQQVATKHYLLFCEHPHVYTLGKSGSMNNLLLTEQELDEKDIEFFKINRGGDKTWVTRSWILTISSQISISTCAILKKFSSGY
jgi:lipoyl(octanoyl) transferase